MSKKIDKIRQLVKREHEESDWKYHILPVVEYARKLAKIYNVNEEIVELAALLHDIGRAGKRDYENHHISGVTEARKILKKSNYPKAVMEEVIHCIESHRGSKDIEPRTMTARIIANADAMAHFDVLPIFFYRHDPKKSFEEIVRWIDEKIERDWNKKLTLPEAKKMVEKKYKAIRLILDSLKEKQMS